MPTRIAVVVDCLHKVQHNRVAILSKLFPEVSFDVFYDGNIKKLNPTKYQTVYYASFSLYSRFPIKHKHIVGSITSHKCLDDMGGTRKILTKFNRLSANNIYLHNKFKERYDILYIPNGVDSEMFCPNNRCDFNKNIVIGWVGNIDRHAKNYYTVLCPIIKQASAICKFNCVKTEKRKKVSLSPINMVQFYNKLHYFLVTSSTEGTPNPALEAASCGVPVISPKVGNMPELIKNGENGFFVPDMKIASFLSVLKYASEISKDTYDLMSKNIRQNIVEEWDWKYRQSLYKDLFSIV